MANEAGSAAPPLRPVFQGSIVLLTCDGGEETAAFLSHLKIPGE